MNDGEPMSQVIIDYDESEIKKQNEAVQKASGVLRKEGQREIRKAEVRRELIDEGERNGFEQEGELMRLVRDGSRMGQLDSFLGALEKTLTVRTRLELNSPQPLQTTDMERVVGELPIPFRDSEFAENQLSYARRLAAALGDQIRNVAQLDPKSQKPLQENFEVGGYYKGYESGFNRNWANDKQEASIAIDKMDFGRLLVPTAP